MRYTQIRQLGHLLGTGLSKKIRKKVCNYLITQDSRFEQKVGKGRLRHYTDETTLILVCFVQIMRTGPKYE